MKSITETLRELQNRRVRNDRMVDVYVVIDDRASSCYEEPQVVTTSLTETSLARMDNRTITESIMSSSVRSAVEKWRSER